MGGTNICAMLSQATNSHRTDEEIKVDLGKEIRLYSNIKEHQIELNI